jgi:hypothetical protein
MATGSDNAEEVFEAGIFALTADGWSIADRRKFADCATAMRWVKSRTRSMQRRFPLGRIRVSVIQADEWLTLETVLDRYEQKRLAGDSEYCLRPAVEHVVVPLARSIAGFTPRQGQFLAFIYYFTKLNGQPPAEADMERYFKISESSVHQMVVTLHEKGLIQRTRGAARSIRLLVPRDQLPDLE